MVLPPAADATTAPRAPREVTYIIDTSGSMEGVSIDAGDARRCCMALDRLQPGDRFNVIEFNSVDALAVRRARAASTARRSTRARTFVAALRARGGTEMLPALEVALARRARATSMLRQVVFLTDGAVGNEDRAPAAHRAQRLGDRRLFTVGIGPAPNTFFMTKAAQFGRGTFTFIGDVREVQGEDDRALPQAREPGADRHRRRLAGRRVDVWPRAAAGPVRGRAGRR